MNSALILALIPTLLSGPPRFEDVTDAVGINSIRLASGFMPTTAGAAWLDWNDDGHLDVLLGGDEEPVRLMVSTGADHRFEDATTAAGLEDVRGVISVDVMVIDDEPALVFAAQPDGDLWELQVWRRSAAGKPFRKTVVTRWLSPYLLAHGDLDGDTDHDLIASVAVECSSFAREPVGLFRFDNDSGVLRASTAPGWPALGCLGVPMVTDFGAEGSPAVLYTNDYGPIHTPTVVLRDGALRDGVLRDQTERRDLPRLYGMGIASTDSDGDLVSDYFFSSIQEDALVESARGFDRAAPLAAGAIEFGVEGWRVKWGATFFDADNDGADELYATSGYLETSEAYLNDFLQRSILLHEDRDIASEAGLATETRDTTAVAVDYDADGRMDLLVGAVGSWYLFRNVTEAVGHWVQLAIPNAPGTRIVVTCDGQQQMREFTGGVAGTSPPPIVHFGLAGCSSPVDVVAYWPWGGTTQATGLAVDTRHVVERGRLTVSPKVADPGETVTVQWDAPNPANSVVVNGVTLSGDPPSGTLIAPEASQGLQLEVDGESRAAPTLRVRRPWAIHADPDPLPRDVPATIHVSGVTPTAGDALTVSGADILSRGPRGDGEYELEIVANTTVAVTHGEEQRTLETVAPVDPAVSELTARLITDEGGAPRVELRVVPFAYAGMIPPVDRSVVSVTRDGEPTEADITTHELNGFVITTATGGTLEVIVAGVTLEPAIETTRLTGSLGAGSQLFPLYETARADGQDLVTLILRPMSQPGHILSGGDSGPDRPQTALPQPEGLELVESWRPIHIALTPMWAATLRTTMTPGPVTLRVGTLETTVVQRPAHHAPVSPDHTTATWNDDQTQLTIVPRDENGHLVGSGVDIQITSDPAAASTPEYVGNGRYEWRAAVRSVSLAVRRGPDADETFALTLAGGLPPESAGMCAVSTEHSTRSVSGVFFLLLLAGVVSIVVLTQVNRPR